MKRLSSTLIQSLTWLALLLALAGSLTHVAWAFSTLEEGDMVMGYVQAVAVDLGLFAMALGVYVRKRQKRSTLALWIGTLLFAGLSTYANLLHGLVFKSDIGLSEWSLLDAVRPFALSAILPLLVVYLSEVAGSDVSHTLQEADKAERRARKKAFVTTGFEATPEAAERARNAKAVQDALSKEQAMDAMVEVWATNPNATYRELEAVTGKAKSTLYNYRKEMIGDGRIRFTDNGGGVEVLE